MSGKNVTTVKRVQKKEAVKYATAGINAYKIFLNNQRVLYRIKVAIQIILGRYK